VARALPPKALAFEPRPSLGREGMEAFMNKIAQANIDRFNLMLKTETDPTKRAMMIRILGEEKEKLKALTKEA
jgi:hypothetical protein